VSGFEELPERITRRGPVVVVAGDAMVDRWWHGPSHRLSREAPVPVVEIADRVESPGGAANAAMNLRAMGARVRLVGAVGADAAGDALVARLEQAGIDTTGLVRSPLVATVTKTRIVADDQVLVRADETPVSLAEGPRRELAEEVATALAESLRGADALLVSDYGGSSLGAHAVRAAFEVAGRPPLLAVDAHQLGAWRDFRPEVVVPNAAEAEQLLGTPFGHEEDRLRAVDRGAEALLAATGASVVVVTLDRDGAAVLRQGVPMFRTLAHPVSERFASGAGDTFAAALVAALAVGGALHDAARLAQAAADVAVRRLGTTVCDAADLLAEVTAAPAAVIGFDELVAAIRRDRRDGRRIVFTNGCFDVLHRGHTAYLRQARRLGDRLVVAVNGDASVRRLKGPSRPVNGEDDRAAVLAALECVDYVTVFDGDTPIPLLQAVRPDVYVKGGDYSPEMLEETPVVRAYGGEVRTVDYVPDHSTTALLERVRATNEDATG
jgi:D-beta-D-heptose 7-phosphate kinase / D-beta-D-heptose 1-phosphate adenosyltransferase